MRTTVHNAMLLDGTDIGKACQKCREGKKREVCRTSLEKLRASKILRSILKSEELMLLRKRLFSHWRRLMLKWARVNNAEVCCFNGVIEFLLAQLIKGNLLK